MAMQPLPMARNLTPQLNTSASLKLFWLRPYPIGQHGHRSGTASVRLCPFPFLVLRTQVPSSSSSSMTPSGGH